MSTAPTTKPLPPTGVALLRALRGASGVLAYTHEAVSMSGLTALRHRGLARVQSRDDRGGARVVLTDAGRLYRPPEGA